MATKVFFTIEQGVALDKVIHRVRTTMGANVDMSAYTGVVTIKKNYKAAANDALTFNLTATFNSNGDVRVQANAALTDSIRQGRYVYDVIGYVANTATSVRVCEGYVAVEPGVADLP